MKETFEVINTFSAAWHELKGAIIFPDTNFCPSRLPLSPFIYLGSGFHCWQWPVQEGSSSGKHPAGGLQLHRGEASLLEISLVVPDDLLKCTLSRPIVL